MLYPDATSTSAGGINDSGEIIGHYNDSSGAEHGFSDVNGQYTSIDAPGAGFTTAQGINSSGEIVGYYRATPDSAAHGFLDNNGAYTTIDYPGNVVQTAVYDINDSGSIVGSYTSTSGVVHGFLDNSGTYTTVDYPGATITYPAAINNSGEIVGQYAGSNGIYSGFVYQNGTYTTLNVPGATQTLAEGVNNAGEIAGIYIDSSGVTHGFIDNSGTITSIDEPGATSTNLHGINDKGQIAGFATINGQTDGFIAAMCFCTGTLIRTPTGDRPVETLAVGDLVVTTSGDQRPIRWLGHRRGDPRRAPDRKAAMPVRIAAGAFGPGTPARDLFVSPGHAICVQAFDEVLIPTSAFINGSTITQVEVDEITYWHVELDSHDVLLANGLPAESFIDVGNRKFFAGSGIVDLAFDPDATPKTLDDYCRPFFDGGPLVEAVRDRMRHRALAMGWSIGGDALGGLHLLADGVRIDPDARGLHARFVVPATARDCWLVSDSSVPCDTGVGKDRRDLGACIGALAVDDGLSVSRDIAIGDVRLATGFHAVEDGIRRWTDGRAKLSPELWQGCRGSFFLRVDLAMASPARWVAPACASATVMREAA